MGLSHSKGPSAATAAKEKKPIVVVTDGVIAAGKSVLNAVLRRLLEEEFGETVVSVPEPVGKWKKNGRLKKFYGDPSRRGYQFQTCVFHDRISLVRSLRDENATVYLLERSIFTDVLFMNMLLESGTIDATEHEDYMSLWKMWKELMPVRPQLFVYLRPSIGETLSRLQERARDGESAVTEEYQRKLQAEHDRFFCVLDEEGAVDVIPDETEIDLGDGEPAHCLLLRTDENFRDDEEVAMRIARRIHECVCELRHGNARLQ